MEQEMTIDLTELFAIIKKRIWLIIAITLATTLISAVLSFFVLKPVYEAKISIIIGRAEIGEKVKTDYNEVLMYQKLVKTYAEIAKSKTVVEKTINELGKSVQADDYLKNITAIPQPDTQILVLKYQSKDPVDAATTINTHAKNFIEESKRFYPDGNIQIIDAAQVPENPVKPKKMLNIAIAFVLGVMLSLGLVFILEYMDTTVKTEDDVEKLLDLPVVGIIPNNKDE
ncbi:YveK family protein [Thermobrachium celere]|uniref:Tyrosine-protein kinase transmembrane modulator EpsC n=1 Tax=Thermobrachium celere DSM 8682 TaxID=941824 RepID=R7RR30_9CLOT|nr:Wzz/FepE/Etk N-terminal domain-containing protein [Thermobrachium celere]CDF57715.1 Tyrosine-protein kinase transmembrane modulator EpsC [Thermobrachium celere DSM 8682]